MALQLVQARVNLRYQFHDLHHGDEVILSTISNYATGNVVGVFKIEANQAYLKLIGTIDKYALEHINAIARSQKRVRIPPGPGGAWGRPRGPQRGGARVGSNFAPDIATAHISPAGDQLTGYPPNYGRPGPGQIEIILDVMCRT